jgi:Polyketide cyclase / dehydrase and lipid transport
VPATRVFTSEVSSPASAASLYRLLADAPSWSQWAGPLITYAEWEIPPGQHGVTPVRRLGRRPFLVREEIVVAEEPFRHAYRLLSGQPVRSYEAEVRLTEDAAADGHTRIVWTARVIPLVSGVGPVTEQLFARMVAGFARRLASFAAAAEHEGTAGLRHD